MNCTDPRDNVTALKKKQNIYAMVEQILVILFTLALLFIPMFKTAHKYTPASADEIASLDRGEAEQLLESGYVEKGSFSVMDEFVRMLKTVTQKSSDGDDDVAKQNRIIAFVTGIVNICIVICAAAVLVLGGVELYEKCKKLIGTGDEGTVSAPGILPRMSKTVKLSLIMFGLLLADVIYAAFIWGYYANSLAADFDRYMIYVSGVTFGAFIVILLLVAVMFVKFLKDEINKEILGTRHP